MARPSWRGKAWAQINAEMGCRLMGLPGSLRGAPCILRQLGGGPSPGKPPPDRGLPHHGLLFPRGLSERVPASTRREETGIPGTCHVRGRWSEPSPPPRLHPQGRPPPRLTWALGRAHSCQCGELPAGLRGHSWGQGWGRHAGDLREVQGGLGGPSAPADLAAPAGGKSKEGQTWPGIPAPCPASPLSPSIPGVSAARGVWPTPLPACFLCLPHPSSRPWPWGPAARGCQDWLGLSPHPRPGGRCPTPSGRSQCGHSLTSWLLPTPHRPALDFKGPSLRQNLLRRHARDNSPRVHCHLNVLHSFNTHSHRRFQELITQRPRLGPA